MPSVESICVALKACCKFVNVGTFICIYMFRKWKNAQGRKDCGMILTSWKRFIKVIIIL